MSDKVYCCRLESVLSTNAHLKSSRHFPSGYVLFAKEQTQGKGMGDNTWESNKDENITGSIIFLPQNIQPQDAFVISMVTSTAIVEFLKKENIIASIKWPNDIFVDNKKLAGILIENEFSAYNITRSIIGIGLNVNQTEFKYAPNPVSIKMLTNRSYDVDKFGEDLFTFVFDALQNIENRRECVLEAYHQYLRGRKKKRLFKDEYGEFYGVIEHVDSDGRIAIRDDQNKYRFYYFKEVVYLEV